MRLTPKQKHELRAKAHQLKPVVLIGGKGITKAVLKELAEAIDHHELIKVKVAGADKEGRVSATEYICNTLKCESIQNIGNIIVLYKKSDKQ